MQNTVAHRIGSISPFYVMALLQRAKQLEALGRDVIHMEIGEPDFATPKPLLMRQSGISRRAVSNTRLLRVCHNCAKT